MNTTNRIKNIIYILLALVILGGVVYAMSTKDRKSAGEYTIAEIKNLPSNEQQQMFEDLVIELDERLNSLLAGNDEAAQKEYEIEKYRILIKLADAQNELKRYQDSISSLDKIVETQKRNPTVLKAYTIAYKGLGQKEQALEKIKQAVEEDSTNQQLWLIYLDISSDLPNDQLDLLYRDAISKTKSNVDIMISYAKFNERIGDKATAIAAWETAINGNPEKESEYRAEIARLRQ